MHIIILYCEQYGHLNHSGLHLHGSTVISIAITPTSMVIIIAIMLEASMKKNTKLLHLIASKLNYMRRTSITCRHTGRYTIIGQPQPGCCNGDTQVTKIITHRSSHDIEAIPFTSHPAKTS